jgi:hypothetical protein
MPWAPVHILNQIADFNETWYEYCTVGGHQNVAIFNFIQSITTAQEIRKLVKWV